MEALSPELALVDEQLDRSARLGLPEQPDHLTADPNSDSPRPRRTGSAATLGGGLLVALAVGISALLLLGNDRKPGPSAPGGTTTVAEQTPVGTKAFNLRWQPVRGATLYNVILWRNGARALDLWPTAASVRVPEGRLAPGVYQWFVYPAFGTGNARSYGRVVAHGRLRI